MKGATGTNMDTINKLIESMAKNSNMCDNCGEYLIYDDSESNYETGLIAMKCNECKKVFHKHQMNSDERITRTIRIN